MDDNHWFSRRNVPLLTCFFWSVLCFCLLGPLSGLFWLMGEEQPNFDAVCFLAIGSIGIAVVNFMFQVRETLARLENREPGDRGRTPWTDVGAFRTYGRDVDLL